VCRSLVNDHESASGGSPDSVPERAAAAGSSGRTFMRFRGPRKRASSSPANQLASSVPRQEYIDGAPYGAPDRRRLYRVHHAQQYALEQFRFKQT
jgi:hypothetical protein